MSGRCRRRKARSAINRTSVAETVVRALQVEGNVIQCEHGNSLEAGRVEE